jgi:hypothetical protein
VDFGPVWHLLEYLAMSHSHLLNGIPPIVAATLVARLLEKDPRTLRRWSRKGHLPPTIRLNGRNYYRLADLCACPLFSH